MGTLETPLRRLLPEPGAVTVGELVAGFDPAAAAPADRPSLYTNFALTVDGRATIDGRSGTIGSDADTAMLVGLRMRADAVMIGAGTLRAEGYGALIRDPAKRAQRERQGLDPEPLTVLVSERLAVPWTAPLFTEGTGRVVIFTAAGDEPPATATPVEIVRHPGGVDLDAALRTLRAGHGVRALLCEGGPTLHGALLAAGLVDDLFVTRAPRVAGGPGPGLFSGLEAGVRELDLVWLCESRGELFARYSVR
ncbi:MAG: dihydrofolate reductase family protein [Thermoleophilia bacterium]|nr:dihydrofolate reductase family protein [Thermoleophilia bacterium]